MSEIMPSGSFSKLPIQAVNFKEKFESIEELERNVTKLKKDSNEILITLKDHYDTINRTYDKIEYAEEWIHTTQDSFVDIMKPINYRLEKLEQQMAVVLVEMPNYPDYAEK